MRIFARLGFISLLFLFGGCTVIDDLTYDIRQPHGRVAVLIDLSDQHAYLTSAGSILLAAPVSTGREGHDTPSGRFSVIEKDLDHRSSVYGAYCRPDRTIVIPNVDVRKDPKPSGTIFIGAPMPYFMRIVGGVGLHAGYLPGYPASHGCIRMPESKARRFYDAVRIGTPVTIKH